MRYACIASNNNNNNNNNNCLFQTHSNSGSIEQVDHIHYIHNTKQV